jgi:hypothetical protein
MASAVVGQILGSLVRGDFIRIRRDLNNIIDKAELICLTTYCLAFCRSSAIWVLRAE